MLARISFPSSHIQTQYILNNVLLNTRVSAQSLGLACITAAVDICPPILQQLAPLEVFANADDPNLRCRFSKVLTPSSVLLRCEYEMYIIVGVGSIVELVIKATTGEHNQSYTQDFKLRF